LKGLKVGKPVKVRGLPVPFTFWPEAYLERGRLVTSDPWACLMGHVHQTAKSIARRNLAIAFLEQAQDFHHAAKAAPRMGSKPLLHYYSFMNLAKLFLALRTSLDLKRCAHGLGEPARNIGRKLTIASQAVKISDSSTKRLQLYREFIEECGFAVPVKPKPTKVIDLLEQIVGIHRITSHTLKRNRQYFPITNIMFEFDRQNKKAWITLYVNRAEVGKAAADVRKHSTSFVEVESLINDQRRYESKPMRYTKSPIQVLRQLVLNTWKDIWSELRPGGYRFWMSSIDNRKRRAQLASGYQTMFYFGSVSRYRPDDFYKLAEGKHGWMVQEFINTQPVQFIYFLGSGIVNAEMVVPELT
jgi:hypothetical protein